MNQLNNLSKTTTKKKKRLGRGYGSGKGGHTVGRGQKGQKSRTKIHLLFEGKKTQKSLLRRIPLLRGKGKLKSKKNKPLVVNVSFLNLLPPRSKVDVNLLVKHHLVDEKEVKKYGVKILGGGELGRALTVYLFCSKGAREKIEKAGGEVIKSSPKTAKSEKRIVKGQKKVSKGSKSKSKVKSKKKT